MDAVQGKPEERKGAGLIALPLRILIMLDEILFDEVRGNIAQRTEPYFKYGEGVAQMLTKKFAKRSRLEAHLIDAVN